MLYEKNHNAVYRYLFFRTGDKRTAEDLTADVFVRMLQGVRNFKGPHGAFRPWLLRIARNLSIDHLRRNVHRTAEPLQTEPLDRQTGPEASLIKQVNAEILHQAVSQLKEEQKEVILLRFVQELTLQETAEMLGKSQDSIKALQRRGLEALRRNLIGERKSE